jgi:hypothetical protein
MVAIIDAMHTRLGPLRFGGLVCALALLGCEGGAREVGSAVETSVENTASVLTDRIDQEQIEALRKLAYPADAEVGEDLDMVVSRRGGRITLINRTPQSYENVLLWLNRQYVHSAGRIAIGPDNTLALRTFVNHYGETFPVGGLLSPDKGFPVVSAELYDPLTNTRHRLTVWQ